MKNESKINKFKFCCFFFAFGTSFLHIYIVFVSFVLKIKKKTKSFLILLQKPACPPPPPTTCFASQQPPVKLVAARSIGAWGPHVEFPQPLLLFNFFYYIEKKILSLKKNRKIFC